MKLRKTIKRIVALGTGATMLGATVLGAMAADLSEYPSPMFIKDGRFDGLIVIGADGDTQDMLGAMDIISSLQAVAVSGNTGTSATTTTVGDVYKFEKSSNNLNFGEDLADIRSKLSETQLPIVLADGTLTTSKGAKFNYEQEITILATGSTVQHFADKDYEDDKPVVGVKFARNADILNYTLDFSKDALSTVDTDDDISEFEDRQIEILGEVFDIIASDNSSKELEIMRGALKPTLEEGETQTYLIDGKEYETTALIIDDTNSKVKMKINGEVTDSLAKGDIYQLSDGVNVGIREILPNEAGDVTQDMVEFYIGAKKIKLTHGEELEIDDEDISNVDVTVQYGGTTTTGKTDIDRIAIAWVADDDIFLTEDGNEVVMPGLESLKLYMDGFYSGLDEEIKVYPSSTDTITLDAPLKGYDVSLDLLYDSNGDGVWNYTGASATKQTIANTCGSNFTFNLGTDEYFVLSKINGKEGESAVLEVSKISNSNGVTIRDYAGTTIAENKRATKTFDAADMTVTIINYTQESNNVTMKIATEAEKLNCVNDTLVTAEGLTIELPSDRNHTREFIPSTVVLNGTYVITINTEDKDETLNTGEALSLNLTFNSDNEAHVKIMAKTNLSNGKTYSVDNTKVYEGYVNDSVSMKVTEDKTADQYSFEIVYAGEETYAEIYLGSKASQVTTSAGGESIAATKIEVGAAVLDTSLATYTSQNLIVVGGPAINRAAAALTGKTYPAYGAASGITENTGMLKLVEQADGTVAVIVAGWEADDTQRASRVLAEYNDYALTGMEVVISGTSMTDIDVGVPA